MSFTGKATTGGHLPEQVEDLSDIVGIVSPYETPLLDHLGDPQRAATSTKHEWLEDVLLPNQSMISESGLDDNCTSINVADGLHFRIGDLVQPSGSREVMLVTGIRGEELTLVRGYGKTSPEPVGGNTELRILGNAALEGTNAPAARFTTRSRHHNLTQIFTATAEASENDKASVSDELDYQKAERVRELIRDLENCVINGTASDTDKRRAMRGIIPSLTTHRFDADGEVLSEARVNESLRAIWEQSSGSVDTIVVGGFLKRRFNQFIASGRSTSDSRFRDLVSIYESDFGVCRIVLSRWVPRDVVLLLDSSRIDVMPLAGRSFHYRQLAATDDRETGQVIGEYTLELRNENAHGIITGLATA